MGTDGMWAAERGWRHVGTAARGLLSTLTAVSWAVAADGQTYDARSKCVGRAACVCNALSFLTWRTCSKKNCCNFSLAKLMQSCSNELWTKFSKPKMSSRPTYGNLAASGEPMMNAFTCQ